MTNSVLQKCIWRCYVQSRGIINQCSLITIHLLILVRLCDFCFVRILAESACLLTPAADLNSATDALVKESTVGWWDKGEEIFERTLKEPDQDKWFHLINMNIKLHLTPKGGLQLKQWKHKTLSDGIVVHCGIVGVDGWKSAQRNSDKWPFLCFHLVCRFTDFLAPHCRVYCSAWGASVLAFLHSGLCLSAVELGFDETNNHSMLPGLFYVVSLAKSTCNHRTYLSFVRSDDVYSRLLVRAHCYVDVCSDLLLQPLLCD